MKSLMFFLLFGATMLFTKASTTPGNGTKRVVDCALEDYILIATSQTEDGAIIKVQIFNSLNQLKLEEDCGGHSCHVDVSDLKSGTYTAKVFTTNAPVYSEGFSIP